MLALHLSSFGPLHKERVVLRKRICISVMVGLTSAPAIALAHVTDAAAGDLPPAISVQGDFREVVRRAKAEVFPALVFLRCLRETHETGERQSQEVSGSGVLISPDGYLLTNWHVVDRATQVRCLLYDGQAYHAEIIGTDRDTDLALVRLQMPDDASPLPYARLGDSSRMAEGDFVMAMGAPWGMSRSVSIGIVSSTRRYLPGNSEYSLWLQTDASISPGNSGGPLVNTSGEVIGINTRGVLFGGGVGFSVPSNIVAELVPHFREHGSVPWSWTGIQLQPLRDFNRDIYFEADEGVIVAGTDPDSPARRAGLQVRDRIVRIAGKPVTAMTEEDLPAMRRLLGMLPRDSATEFEVDRNGNVVRLEITPREKGDVEGKEHDFPRWDMTLKAINQFENPSLYFHRNEGVFVFGTKWPGNASRAGLAPQDIILELDGTAVTTLDDVRAIHEQAMANIDTRRRMVVTILRNGLRRQIVLDYSRDYDKN